MSTETTNANAWPALVRSTESGDFFRAPLAATLQGLGALGATPVLLLLMKAMGDEAEPAPALFMAVACASAAVFSGQVLFGRARRIRDAKPVRFSVVPAIRECVRALAEAGFVWSMVLSTAGLLAVLWTAGDDLEQKLPAAFGAAIVIGVGGWLSLLFAHLFTELASALVEIANNTAGGWAARAAAPQSVVAEPAAASGALRSGVADPASTPRDEAALSFGTEPKRDAAGAKLGLAAVGVVVVVGGLFWMGGGESGGGESGNSDFQSPTLGTMKWIPTGTFTMGSAISESGRSDDETQHSVTLTKGYYLMEHEVTQGEWQAVMGENPARFTECGPTCPVEQVSWDDAVAFAQKASERDGVEYALPTEAQWEYAARGGQAGTQQTIYSGSNEATAVGWISDNTDNKTHAVCGKARNEYGLCDMTGNVWEWTSDGYGDYGGSETDPTGAATLSGRVVRGGGWNGSAHFARVAFRGKLTQTVRERPEFAPNA